MNISPTAAVGRRRETDALNDTPALWGYVCCQGPAPGPFLLPRAPRCCV